MVPEQLKNENYITRTSAQIFLLAVQVLLGIVL